MKRRFVKTSKEWRQRLLYAASAIASAFADYCINYIAIVLGLPMFFSVLSSKTGSSLLNYALNRNYVFRQGNKAAPNVSIVRYYCLWVTQTIIGSALAAFVVSLAAASNPTQKNSVTNANRHYNFRRKLCCSKKMGIQRGLVWSTS